LPEDDVVASVRSVVDPGRLEGLLISAQADGYAKQILQFGGASLSKLYLSAEVRK
jgi:hypothetical protein